MDCQKLIGKQFQEWNSAGQHTEEIHVYKNGVKNVVSKAVQFF